MNLFCALGTQWNIVCGMSGAFYTGLNYQSAYLLARMKRIRMTEALSSDLQIMESAALSVLNEKEKG